MIDPRLVAVDRRLAEIEQIVAVTGGKGGIGKSLVASTLALELARRGRRTGLLDLDLTGPTDHVVLGAPLGFPEESFGVDPPEHHGVRFLSLAHFAGEAATPLRGPDLTNALLELLAIARWGALDVLVIDMPPGLGDATLDAARLIRRARSLVVATPSALVLETVRRTLQLLASLRVPVAGVVENMARAPREQVAELAAAFEVPYLGALPHDPTLEDALGHPERLLATPFAGALARCADTLLASA